MDWTVTQATPETAPIVRDVARESWHAAYDEFLCPETVDGMIDEWYAIDELTESIAAAAEREDATFLLAVSETEIGTGIGEDGEVAGFAHAGVSPDTPSIGSLVRLYARPSVWGTGVGTALLERVETDLRSVCDRLRLVVLADNEVGVSFYESRGFDRVETRAADVGDGLEECVYEKPL
ncbi:GNAT family N-acetyltransferase [Halosolutus gelatinilyticus]|uniref:GNAT family N-acetyltransferase n=1 Tax=Halosolutus gelatinilyticus TaxID=2931975 RepID=UPI001FF28E4E|nr:GNAT family N-acetyltransferase [Halosolutus gelatinilyticus]